MGRVGYASLAMAEYFRDVYKSDILIFVDNVFRFLQAGSEVSTLLGRMPSAVGYQPTLSSEMGAFQERIVATVWGSITSIQAVYVPADDLTDPAPVVIFSHLDAVTVLKMIKNENLESSHTEVDLGLASALILVKSYANWLIVELNQICYGGILRTIALGFTEGISSWKVEALCSSQALVVPVGRSTLGRLFNVLGANIDAYIGLNELPIYAEGPTNFEEICEQTTNNLQRVYHSQVRENKREI